MSNIFSEQLLNAADFNQLRAVDGKLKVSGKKETSKAHTAAVIRRELTDALTETYLDLTAAGDPATQREAEKHWVIANRNVDTFNNLVAKNRKRLFFKKKRIGTADLKLSMPEARYVYQRALESLPVLPTEAKTKPDKPDKPDLAEPIAAPVVEPPSPAEAEPAAKPVSLPFSTIPTPAATPAVPSGPPPTTPKPTSSKAPVTPPATRAQEPQPPKVVIATPPKADLSAEVDEEVSPTPKREATDETAAPLSLYERVTRNPGKTAAIAVGTAAAATLAYYGVRANMFEGLVEGGQDLLGIGASVDAVGTGAIQTGMAVSPTLIEQGICPLVGNATTLADAFATGTQVAPAVLAAAPEVTAPVIATVPSLLQFTPAINSSADTVGTGFCYANAAAPFSAVGPKVVDAAVTGAPQIAANTWVNASAIVSNTTGHLPTTVPTVNGVCPLPSFIDGTATVAAETGANATSTALVVYENTANAAKITEDTSTMAAVFSKAQQLAMDGVTLKQYAKVASTAKLVTYGAGAVAGLAGATTLLPVIAALGTIATAASVTTNLGAATGELVAGNISGALWNGFLGLAPGAGMLGDAVGAAGDTVGVVADFADGGGGAIDAAVVAAEVGNAAAAADIAANGEAYWHVLRSGFQYLSVA